MKTSMFSLVALASLVAAVDIPSKLPPCSNDCILSQASGSNIAGCEQLNIACVCKNQNFIQNIACCLEKACDKADQEIAIQYAKNICSTAGVKTPDALTGLCKKDSGSGSDSSSSKSAAASTAAKDSSTMAPATESTAAPATTGTGTTAAAPGTTTGTDSAGTPTTKTDATAGGQSSTGSVSPTATPDAAGSLSGMGGAVAGVLAMILAL